MQYGMAVKEGASSTVLTAEAYVSTLVEQRGIGQVLRKAPVTGLFPGCHESARFEGAADTGMGLEAVRQFELVHAEFGEQFPVHAGVRFVTPVMVDVGGPVGCIVVRAVVCGRP